MLPIIPRPAAETYRSTLSLHNALRYGSERLASILIDEQPYMVFVQDRKGRSPLHIAARRRCSEQIINRLFDHGARDDVPDLRGRLPVHCAVWGKESVHVMALSRLLQSRRFALDTPTNDGKTPLLIAAKRGHAIAVQLLLRAGATPNCFQPRKEEDQISRPITNLLSSYNDLLSELPVPVLLLATPIWLAIDVALVAPAIGQAIATPIQLYRANKHRSITPLQIAAMRGHRHVAEMLQIAYFLNKLALSPEETCTLAKRGWDPLSDTEIRARLVVNPHAAMDVLPDEVRDRLLELAHGAHAVNATLPAECVEEPEEPEAPSADADEPEHSFQTVHEESPISGGNPLPERNATTQLELDVCVRERRDGPENYIANYRNPWRSLHVDRTPGAAHSRGPGDR